NLCAGRAKVHGHVRAAQGREAADGGVGTRKDRNVTIHMKANVHSAGLRVELHVVDAAHAHAVDAHGAAGLQAARIIKGCIQSVRAAEKGQIPEVTDAQNQNHSRDNERDSYGDLLRIFHDVVLLSVDLGGIPIGAADLVLVGANELKQDLVVAFVQVVDGPGPVDTGPIDERDAVGDRRNRMHV